MKIEIHLSEEAGKSISNLCRKFGIPDDERARHIVAHVLLACGAEQFEMQEELIAVGAPEIQQMYRTSIQTEITDLLSIRRN